MAERIRKINSIKNELIAKSRESMLCAVQVFNNPNMGFKSENFIVLSIISWTYLLHAYYRSKGIDYRYFEVRGKRKKFDKTKGGAVKHWELEKCLNDRKCPIDKPTKENLKFLIGLRHEIEHQMTTRIDDYLSARFQSCCLNYNRYLKTLFDDLEGIDKHLSFSLQFSSIEEEQVKELKKFDDLPRNISQYINNFDEKLNDEYYNDQRYSYRVIFVPKNVNKRGQADKVIEFIPADSDAAKGLNAEYAFYRDREKPKYKPMEIKDKMVAKGYTKFTVSRHTDIWKLKDAKNPDNNFGVDVSGQWYWYENWLKVVEEHCKLNQRLYK